MRGHGGRPLETTHETLFPNHLEAMRRRLEDSLDDADGLVLFAGQAPVPSWDDQPYPFRIEPFFAQWCPYAAAPGSALALAPGRKPRLIAIIEQDFWHAPPEEPRGFWAGHFDIDTVPSSAERDAILRRHARGFAALGGDPATAAYRPAADATLGALRYWRAFKTDFEIACIRRANDIAARGHRAIASAFAAGLPEFELEQTYMRETGQRHDELPYSNIVAANEHAATLHYQGLDRDAPEAVRSLLVDAGARFLGYAADITRTQLAASPALMELHESMENLQQTLASRAVAGVEFVDLNDAAHTLLATVLADHGLVRSGPEAAYELGITRLFLPHGLGHLLGLQVHDVGGWQRGPSDPPTPPPEAHPFLRLTRRLEPGFVVTIEPGIYFIDSLLESATREQRRELNLALIEELAPWGGIRIEDDVAVKAGDNINLTREAFAAAAPP